MNLVAVWHPVTAVVTIGKRGERCPSITRSASSWPKAKQACRSYLQGIDASIELSDQLGRWTETTSSSWNVWAKVTS